MTERLLRSRQACLVAVLMLTLVAITASLAVATPAQAASCVTRGHAYVHPLSGGLYFSGYEGDGSVGIPTWYTFRGDRFQLGGNGIKPGTQIRWTAYDTVFGNAFPIVPSVTAAAGSNCVVRQEANTYIVTAVPGFYFIVAEYTAGNSGWTGAEIVTYASVS